MSEFGVGPEDWIEFDLDYVARDHRERITDLLAEHRERVVELIGGEFTVEFDVDDKASLMIDGHPVGRAERTTTDRLVVTRFPAVDGPL